MKVLIYILGGFVITLLGCSKSLDSKPYSFTSAENFYQTAADAELALVGCYNAINAETVQGVMVGGAGATFNGGMPIMLCAGTDELVTRNGLVNQFSPFGLFNLTSQNELIRYNWLYLFAGVNRANYLIDNISNVEMNESRRTEILGEARFLRGMFYMYLSMLYGGVPVFTQPAHEPTLPRSPIEEVYRQVISDFSYAYQSLPDRAGIPGRADKWSAAGFLAKVFTYLASCKINQVGIDLNDPLNSFEWVDASDMYAQSLSITSAIIQNGNFKLIDNYSYLFRESTNSWKAQESLFSSVSSSNPIAGNFHVMVFFQVPVGNTNLVGGGYGQFRPTGELYLKYNAADKRRNHNLTFALTANSAKEVIEGATYYVPATMTNIKNASYNVGKFRMIDPATKKVNLARSTGDLSLVRYADVLMLHAEALYYAGRENEAREFIRMVRRRSVNNDTELTVLTNNYRNSNFLQELLDERSRELCFENWRRIDLIRFGKLGTVVSNLDPGLASWNTIAPTLKENWASHKIWYPLPLTELELSPALRQNPGY